MAAGEEGLERLTLSEELQELCGVRVDGEESLGVLAQPLTHIFVNALAIYSDSFSFLSRICTVRSDAKRAGSL